MCWIFEGIHDETTRVIGRAPAAHSAVFRHGAKQGAFRHPRLDRRRVDLQPHGEPIAEHGPDGLGEQKQTKTTAFRERVKKMAIAPMPSTPIQKPALFAQHADDTLLDPVSVIRIFADTASVTRHNGIRMFYTNMGILSWSTMNQSLHPFSTCN